MSLTNEELDLAETRLEDRDGSLWVCGICPGCSERIAFRAPPAHATAHVECANGHHLRIAERTSAGQRRPG
jgi:hypothetical protein